MPHETEIDYAWRDGFENNELERLHAEGFAHPVANFDWRSQVEAHSLGWVCARRGGELIGFVNVAWDGAGHAFVLDTTVALAARRSGIGTRLVAIAEHEARRAGCEWLHVDFEDHLSGFYWESCGFGRTPAGVIAL